MERERKRAGKKRGETGDQSLPSFFPALSLALFFALAPLSERLEQARLAATVSANCSNDIGHLHGVTLCTFAMTCHTANYMKHHYERKIRHRKVKCVARMRGGEGGRARGRDNLSN